MDEEGSPEAQAERQPRAAEQRRKRHTIVGWTVAIVVIGGGYVGIKAYRDANSYAVKYEISGNGLMYHLSYSSQSGDKTTQQAGTTADVSTRVGKSKAALVAFSGFQATQLECRIYKDGAVVAEHSYQADPSNGWSPVFECSYDPTSG